MKLSTASTRYIQSTKHTYMYIERISVRFFSILFRRLCRFSQGHVFRQIFSRRRRSENAEKRAAVRAIAVKLTAMIDLGSTLTFRLRILFACDQYNK